MQKSTKIALGASAVVVAGLTAIAVPTVASVHGELSSWAIFDAPEPVATSDAQAAEGPTAEKAPEASPTPRDPLQAAAWEIGCDDFAKVGGYAGYPKPSARPDMGATEYAAGTVTYGDDGGVETYTVAAGDAPQAIGERFCVDYITMTVANDVYPSWEINPGDVLQINP